MKKIIKVYSWLAIVTVVSLITTHSSQVHGEIVTDVILDGEYLYVEYETGGGAEVSYHVIDFATTGGESFAFAYHFDGPSISAHDALVAIADAGALSYAFTMYDFGGGPAPFADNFSYISASGNPSTYWSYTLGSYAEVDSEVSWIASSVGAGEQFLTDGSWHGWYNGFGGPPNYDAISPNIPTASAGAVPEPTSLLLGLCGIWLIVSATGRMRLSKDR